MYLSTGNLGQEEVDTYYDTSETSNADSSAKTIEAVATLTRAVTEPAAQAFTIHTRAKINEERIKAGLPPLLPSNMVPPPPPPKKDNFAIGGIALLVIIFMVLFKSKP